MTARALLLRPAINGDQSVAAFAGGCLCTRIATNALGNALGQGLVDEMQAAAAGSEKYALVPTGREGLRLPATAMEVWRRGFDAPIGNAVGASLAASAAPETQGVGPYSDKNYVNEMDQQDDATVKAGSQEQVGTIIPGLPKTGPYANLNAEMAREYGFVRSDSDPTGIPDALTADGKTVMRRIGPEAVRLDDAIAPLADLRDAVRNISSRAEASSIAADHQRRAEVLLQSADQAEAGGNPSAALSYRRAASNYIVTGGEAERASSLFVDGATLPKTFVNPPEFQVPADWSYMGQNNVGKNVLPFDYVSVNVGFYVGGGGYSVNLHDGEVFGQWALGRSYPAYGTKPSLTVVGGNIINGYGAPDTASFLTGASAQGGYFVPIPIAPVIGAGGGLNHSYGGKTAVEIGLSIPPGAGISPIGYGFEVNKK